jgi:motility quorum-sensing regulator/GCU-specific mRNA interferase toxin
MQSLTKNNLKGYKIYMEQQIPRHDLANVKRLISAGNVIVTGTALSGARALGLGYADILKAALALERGDFYKSMTAYRNHHLWQDVYHPITAVGSVYLKLTIEDQAVILSFKEL